MENNVITEYINNQPLTHQEKLNEIRDIIASSAPQAIEKISWAMPTYYLKGNLVHFACQKNHIGFYPGASGVANFLDKLTEYKTSKGAIQFPLNKPLPKDLIIEIVNFRIKENLDSK